MTAVRNIATILSRRTARAPNRRVAVLGDSRTAGATSGTENAPVWENASYINWARFLVGQRFDFPWANNFGVGGDTTPMMLARLPAALSSSDAGTFVVFGGTNDRGSANLTADETISTLTTIRNMILDAGRLVIFIAEIPRGDTTYTSNRLSGNQLAYHLRVHQWLLDQRSQPGCYVCDAWGVVGVENSATGDIIPGYTTDGLHPGTVGHSVIGEKLASTLAQIFDPVDLLVTSNADVFSAANPNGCLLANPMFDGTSGTPGTGGSGNLATSWGGAGTSSASGVTRTYSKVTSGGKSWQQVVLSGTASGALPSLAVVRQIGLHTNISAGDRIEGSCEVEWETGHSNIIGVRLRIQVLSASTTVADIRDMDIRDISNPLPTGARSGILRIQPFQIQPGLSFDDVRYSVTVEGVDASALALTMRVRAMSLRKVT